MQNTLCDEDKGIRIGGRIVNNLRYADDTTLLAESEEDLKYLLTKVKEESLKMGLHLNMKKTKIMATGNVETFNIDGEAIEVVDCYNLLGSMVNQYGTSSQEIKKRIAVGKRTMKDLDKLFKCKQLSLNIKIKLIQVLIFSTVMYGCESWTLRKCDKKKINAFEMWCWRRLLRIPWTARITNECVLNIIKPHLPLVAQIMKLKLKFFGHTTRKTCSLEKDMLIRE